jgi:hypothetical protein
MQCLTTNANLALIGAIGATFWLALAKKFFDIVANPFFDFF